MSDKPKRFFITGIPTAGKSWAGNLLANEMGAVHVEIDDIRATLQDDLRYSKWINFYFKLNEREYLKNLSPEQRWDDVVQQSEGLWPALEAKIKSYEDEPRPVVFEGVNLMPHLMKKYFPEFDGAVLLGPSFEKTLERNTQSPRWGFTKELQRLEAECFFYDERPRYAKEADAYGYPAFDTATEVYIHVQDIWK